jgi:hypothetical protein
MHKSLTRREARVSDQCCATMPRIMHGVLGI